PGFAAAWDRYPHYENRSVRAEALNRWRKRKLEPLANSVLAWIDAHADTDDWTKDGGAMVPGFHVWIGPKFKHDFSEPPPVPKLRAVGMSNLERKNQANMEAYLRSKGLR
ncbi:MAG: hypothetical protein GY725_16900, partial [bacterium]|nr:hypothetical protein [bacterium]